MKKSLAVILWCLVLLFPFLTYADEATRYHIKGQVVDSLTKESVPYATLKISFVRAPQKAVKLLACDEDGKFQTTLTSSGKYMILMQSIGKATTQRVFVLSEKKKQLDLGKLYMQDDNQRLKEVTVTAQKPLVKVELDKLTYSLQDDPESQTNNTLDMLRKVPMVTVDGEDKIQLKGSSSFKIYMNGKPSNLLSNNPSEVLKSMPANSVKDIEVITDPGAKYDAEGVGGIINIITVKNTLQGYTGTIRANANTMGAAGGGGYLSLKWGKLGLTANYNYNYGRTPWNDSYSFREDLKNEKNHFMTQNGRSKGRGPRQYGYLEASYEIDSLNLLAVGVNLFDGKKKNISEYEVKMEDIHHNPIYNYDRYSLGESQFGSTDVSVDFQHATRKKNELLTLSYRYSHSPNNSSDQTDLENVVNYHPWLGYPQSNENKAYTDEHTGQVDYTTPTLKGQTLELGGKYIFRQSNSRTDRSIFNDSLQRWDDYSSKDSHFKHNQHIYSAYLGYSVKFKKYGIKAGVRAEGTSLNVEYAKAPEMNFDTRYFDVVPNATLSYHIAMAQQLRLGYNMRIHRPGIWHLNPYVNNMDPANISYGNPNLDSEKSNNINLNYSMFAQKFSVNASLSYEFVNNSIEQYTFVDPKQPGVFQTTYGNIGKKQRTGLFVYANWNPIPLFRIYMNGGVNYTDLKSRRDEMKNSGFSGNIFAGTQLNLPMAFRIHVHGGYFTPSVQLQGKNSDFYFMGISVNKDLLKKKLSLSVAFQNPFWKRDKMENTTTDDSFYRVNVNYRTMRMARFSISYRFGTLKSQIKKVRRGIHNDDTKANGENTQSSGQSM